MGSRGCNFLVVSEVGSCEVCHGPTLYGAWWVCWSCGLSDGRRQFPIRIVQNYPKLAMLCHLFRGLRCNQFHISIILKLEALTSG